MSDRAEPRFTGHVVKTIPVSGDVNDWPPKPFVHPSDPLRQRCPACGSPGIYRKVHNGDGWRWAYECGADWNDFGSYPRNVGYDVTMPDGRTLSRSAGNQACVYYRRITELRTENERLRAALEMIATHRDLVGPTAAAYLAKEALDDKAVEE